MKICIDCRHYDYEGRYADKRIICTPDEILCGCPSLLRPEDVGNFVTGFRKRVTAPYCMKVNVDGNCEHFEAKQ